MAKSRFEYVKTFETDQQLLPDTWLVVRIDGRSFHRFTEDHGFARPNDVRGLSLMNACAQRCMEQFIDTVLAYGQSDEYSFILRPDATLFNRRSSKIISVIVSYFASNYVMLWPTYIVDAQNQPVPLQYAPQFDGRVVCYPSLLHIRHYLSWRQADCHINNLYNTCFWAIVHSGKTPKQAEIDMRGELKQKQDRLFTEFGVNYNDTPQQFRGGTTLVKRKVPNTEQSPPSATADAEQQSQRSQKRTVKDVFVIETVHRSMINDDFWGDYQDVFPVELRITRSVPAHAQAAAADD